MKKQKILYLATAALLLTACDPGYSFDFAIQNKTEHDLTIQSLDTTRHLRTVSAPAKTDTMVYASGGMGYAEIPEVSQDVRYDIYGDSVQVIFDDGRTLKYYALSDKDGGLYSFADTNHAGSRYIYQPRMNKVTFKGHAGYCRYTLVVTDDDYRMSE